MVSFADINTALSACDVYAIASEYPVFIGEIGNYLGDTSKITMGVVYVNGVADYNAQDVFLNNTLTLLDQYGIGYCEFAGPPWSDDTAWGLVQSGVADYALDNAGVILVNHMGGETYNTWLNQQSSPTPTPTTTQLQLRPQPQHRPRLQPQPKLPHQPHNLHQSNHPLQLQDPTRTPTTDSTPTPVPTHTPMPTTNPTPYPRPTPPPFQYSIHHSKKNSVDTFGLPKLNSLISSSLYTKILHLKL